MAKLLITEESPEEVLNQKKGLMKHMLSKQPEIPEELDRPRRFFTSDATPEALGKLLMDNPAGVLIYRDELVGLLRSLDKQGREGARQFFLEAWNGLGHFKDDRIGREGLDVKDPCISIFGSIQPGPFSHYIEQVRDDGVGDDGFMPRLQLLVWPDWDQEPKVVDEKPEASAYEKTLGMFRRLSTINSGGKTIGKLDRGENNTKRFLHFDDLAQEAYYAWSLKLEKEIRARDEHQEIKEHKSKYRSLMPKLAAIFHLIKGQSTPVDPDSLERAIRFCDYLESHARRCYFTGNSLEEIAACHLAKHLKAGDLKDGFTVRDVRRKGWAGLTRQKTIEKAIEILVDKYWLDEIPAKRGAPGCPTTRFSINRNVKNVPDDYFDLEILFRG